ncbi:hypothetical protein [Flavobacterium soli]|uniref:hypothetical protein n=1 Tax=Flavobacterium soli TaxID=344881 RepID=UPI0012F71A2F|nr:hypothetical protein [Flavobacterium soli]
MKIGICRICKKNTELSFEHIPPKAAFNKYTKFRSVPYLEYVTNSHKGDYKPKAKLQQGGLGSYCLCKNCNSFLGTNYVPEYFKMAHICKTITQEKDFDRAIFTTIDISPMRFLKQVLSMFICMNDSDFTNDNPQLLEFIRNPKSQILPKRFRLFMYLNNLGQIRNFTHMYTNKYGYVNELTFPPFGFVLSMDPDFAIPITEITHFKNIDEGYRGEVNFELLKLPTHLPFPIDYRTLEEIEETIKNNKEYEEYN